jgi:AcrR family transcriptional regulator
MSRTATTPRSSWIDEGLRALARGGPEAVRVEALARRLGVTKGGFYWHFEGRRELLDAILDRWEETSVSEVIERVESGGGDERARLQRLFAIASASRAFLRADLAVRDWARREPRVAQRLRRVDNRRMDYMRSLFAGFCADADEVEARCLLTMSLFVGSHFIAADHVRRSRADVLELVLERLLA